MIHWKPNLFLPPLGSTGMKFVREVARLLQAYADSSSLERIAMKGIHVAVLQQLLLQKPSKNSKVANRAKHLQRRLDLWHSGDVAALLNEGKCIQKRLSKNPPPSNKSTLARTSQPRGLERLHGLPSPTFGQVPRSEAHRHR